MIPLLALHGFTGSPRSWDFLPDRAALPRIVPALLGHAGANAGSEVASFEAEVDRLAALIPVASSAHVAGYSLGARLALGVALRHPRRVARLTLISGHPGLRSDEDRRARRAADASWCELLITRGLHAFVDAWQAQPLWATQVRLSEAARHQKRAERLSHEPSGLAHSLRVTGLGEMPDYGARLAELRMPVQLIAGQADLKFSELARSMVARLPHAELEIVADAGHDLLLERPELISARLQPGNHT